MRRTGAALGLLSEVPPEDAPTGDYSAQVQPPRLDGQVVTLERVASIPAAYRSIQITATIGAQLRLYAERGGARIASPFLDQPDPWRSVDSLLERILVALATDGNAFLLKTKAANGQVLAVESLNPRTTFVVWEKVRGRWVKSYDATTRDGVKRYSDDQVEHIWLLEVPGHDRGLGPIAACRAALSGVLDVRDYADNWFAETARDTPSGILTSDQRLDPAMAKEYKRAWRNPDADLDERERGRGPQLRVLGQGLHYDPVTLNPEDAQWLQAQNAGVLDICRMFGQPSQYLLASLEGSSLTYTNWQQVDQTYLRTTLYPVYLRKIAAALTNCLPRGQVARFDTSDIERPDAETRARIDAIYLPLGVGTPAESAARENRAVGEPMTAQPTPTPEAAR